MSDSGRYDRSIVEGPLPAAVWKIAWPSMLTNIIDGLQGMVDHILVGLLVGFTANAAIGVNPSTCAVNGPFFQQVRVLPRQRSSRPGRRSQAGSW